LIFEAKNSIIKYRKLKKIMNVEDQKKLVDNITEGKKETLGMNDKFKFQCNGCGKCCFNNDVMVNVYDIIRLRHGLKKTTQEIFQENYINFYIGPSSGLPVISLNFTKIDDKSNITDCPFLIPNFDNKQKLKGWLCKVHNDRPIICKLFPCGRVQRIDIKTKKIEENFILQDTKEDRAFCPGFNSQKEQTLNEFLSNQNFWQSKEGSATFTLILDYLNDSGFYASTKDNQSSKNKSLFQSDSKILILLGNLLYNFDSFNVFSSDPRVRKTIYDVNATQKDFLYVENKIFEVVKKFVNLIKNTKPSEQAFQQFINSLTLGGENINDK